MVKCLHICLCEVLPQNLIVSCMHACMHVTVQLLLSLLYVLVQEEVLKSLRYRESQECLLDPSTVHGDVPCDIINSTFSAVLATQITQCSTTPFLWLTRIATSNSGRQIWLKLLVVEMYYQFQLLVIYRNTLWKEGGVGGWGWWV